ncbi:MAG: hypothetical protein LBO05_03040 [Deltaproteobacteria bacterium]|jgi:Sec-independent protein translocase protein TatA|nr:hypothetical protein [Deltaproteobacteria bacterium]
MGEYTAWEIVVILVLVAVIFTGTSLGSILGRIRKALGAVGGKAEADPGESLEKTGGPAAGGAPEADEE